MLYLIRHGEEDQTVRGGWSHSGLMDTGVLQAERLAESILMNTAMHVHRIFSSDLPRAVQNAERLAQALSFPATAAPQFREINNGLLADMEHVQAERQFPGMFYRALAWDEAYPNGESPHAFYDRIASAWKAFKLPRVEPNMPKTRRHGGLSLFHPWQAPARLRAQNENPIPAAIVFRCAAVFSERIFVRARHKSVRILTYFKLFNAARAGSFR